MFKHKANPVKLKSVESPSVLYQIYGVKIDKNMHANANTIV